MSFQLKDVLETAGPTASLVFASWILLQLLGQKFTSAFDRYRSLATEYRAEETSNARKRHIAEQLPLYKRRCEQMQRATVIGVVAAMLLIFTLLSGTVGTIIGRDGPPLKYAGAGSAVIGLSLLLWAASYLLLENRNVVDALHSELKDMPEIARQAGVVADDLKSPDASAE
jgi:hypothetical protein